MYEIAPFNITHKKYLKVIRFEKEYIYYFIKLI